MCVCAGVFFSLFLFCMRVRLCFGVYCAWYRPLDSVTVAARSPSSTLDSFLFFSCLFQRLSVDSVLAFPLFAVLTIRFFHVCASTEIGPVCIGDHHLRSNETVNGLHCSFPLPPEACHVWHTDTVRRFPTKNTGLMSPLQHGKSAVTGFTTLEVLFSTP